MNNDQSVLETIKKFCRVIGLLITLVFFIWFLLGLISGIPSILDVFGMDGLRYPTGAVIGGLMMAAFGFEESI